MRYKLAPEVDKVAEDLCEKYHTHLECVPRICALRDDEPLKNGKSVMAKTTLLKGKTAFLAGVANGEADWAGDDVIVLIEVVHLAWQILNPEQRIALVDHELCHVIADEDDKGVITYRLLGHDVEEFSQVIARHGFWDKDLQNFLRHIEKSGQLKLAYDEIRAEYQEDLRQAGLAALDGLQKSRKTPRENIVPVKECYLQ